MSGIKVTFIIPRNCSDQNDCSEEMLLAFTTCEQHCGGGLQAQWIHENEYNNFEGLTKKDVFVLAEFEGKLYDKLRTTKCLLVGPRCLSCCLMECKPIPSGPEPVFTVAMRGLIVTASGFNKGKKEEIKKKVHHMGGIYSSVLTEDTTHLVSDNVLSDKYVKSVDKGITIMGESWIHAVWEASLRLNVSGSSADFDTHKLPPFANLEVTTSGITKKDKQMIMKLVEENGGRFIGAFQSETTDVVVLNKNGIGSDKYKAAVEYGKACVLPSWVKESVERGVALPFSKYQVMGATTSSPLSEHRLPDMSLNFSRITNSRPPNNFVDETRPSDLSTMSGKIRQSSQDTRNSAELLCVDRDIVDILENFDMSSVKRAGHIFDGFCVWVTGLEGTHKERAAAIVSRGGGVRYDCPHTRVTHVVSGTKAATANALQALPNVPVLSPMWLVRSVEAGKALDEAEFLLGVKPGTPAKSNTKKPPIDTASPMSKRNLQLLSRGPLNLPPPTSEPEPQPHQDEIVNYYLGQPLQEEPHGEKSLDRKTTNSSNTRLQPDLTDDLEEPTEEIEQIFRDVRIEVQGLEEEAICELCPVIASAGGALLAAGAGGTHVLVPLDFDVDDIITKDAAAVTVLWVKDCLSQQEVLPVEYYHQPVKIPQWGSGGAPLQGVVASLSTYSGFERTFLDEVAKLLGATTQLRFCRRNTANALASTHLICPTAAGDKYQGAVKWGLPAVRGSWLMQCVAEGKRVSEKPHLVGDSKAPPSPEPSYSEHIELGDGENNTSLKDVENQTSSTSEQKAMLPPAVTNVPRRGSLSTPKAKASASDGDDMSPASRYIAMARQGLLGGDSQETPKRLHELKDSAKQEGEHAFRTPPIGDALSTPNLVGLTPTTKRRVLAIKRGEMPSGPISTPTDPFQKKVETPDSAFGAILRPGVGRMSPESRKRLWEVVEELPSKTPLPVKKNSTPLSEIRNRFIAQFSSPSPAVTSDQVPIVPRKLHLEEDSATPPSKIPKLSEIHNAGGNRSTTSSDNTKNTSISGVQNHSGEEKITTSDNRTASSDGSISLPTDVHQQLDRLNAFLTTSRVSQRSRRVSRVSSVQPADGPDSEKGPESQPNVVGWDDDAALTAQTSTNTSPAAPVLKKFMLSSNVDNREEIMEMIQYLGGEVLEGVEFDVEATHLLCATPSRSEKMLGSVAAGRWVLHPAYVVRSRTNGSFLPEEDFEWGNPKATSLPTLLAPEQMLARAAHRWRAARAAGSAGPFTGLMALIHVPAARKRLLTRLITAGGGQTSDDQPPYSNEDINVCFADIKRYPLSERDSGWLVSRRVPVCAPLLLSSYLTDENTPDPTEHCLPGFGPADV